MKEIATFILIIGLFSCNQRKTSDLSTERNVRNYDQLAMLYYHCDTVIRIADTLKIVNTKLDTTIIETGIFTFLQYDYPLTTPNTLIALSKTAMKFDRQGQKEKARESYKDILDFYAYERPEQLKSHSDMNGFLQYEVNSAILCSHAYEKLGDKENAIKILSPFLANVEAGDSRIHERYIQLCIDKYGIDRVRAELNNCGETIRFKAQDAPEKDDWVVNVFGADIGVGKSYETKQMNKTKADSVIRKMAFYEVTR